MVQSFAIFPPLGQQQTMAAEIALSSSTFIQQHQQQNVVVGKAVVVPILTTI
jgi:hypothetical protein